MFYITVNNKKVNINFNSFQSAINDIKKSDKSRFKIDLENDVLEELSIKYEHNITFFDNKLDAVMYLKGLFIDLCGSTTLANKANEFDISLD